GPAPVPVAAQAPAPVQIPPLPSAPATVPPAPPLPPVPITEKPSGAPLPGVGPLPTIINLDSPPAPVVPSATPPVLVNPGTIPVSGAPAPPLPALDEESVPTVTNENPTGRQEPAISLEWNGPPTAKVGQGTEYGVMVRNACNGP